jgi:hypothetical protein
VFVFQVLAIDRGKIHHRQIDIATGKPAAALFPPAI